MTAATTTNPVQDQANRNGWERLFELARRTRTLVTPPMTFEQFLEISAPTARKRSWKDSPGKN